MTLEALVAQLRSAYGDRLVSIVLYGSGASADHDPGKSDYNILVLLTKIDAGALAASSAVARAWREAGNPPPLTMTTGEWSRSSDIFPMEYADILDRNRVLFGSFPTDGIVIARSDLRLQLEQQAMGKLLQLRQGALLAGTDTKRQIALMQQSFSTMLALFRASLRLAGEPAVVSKESVVQAVARLVGLDEPAFLRIAASARDTGTLTAANATNTLALYLSGAEQLNAWLDTYNPKEGLS